MVGRGSKRSRSRPWCCKSADTPGGVKSAEGRPRESSNWCFRGWHYAHQRPRTPPASWRRASCWPPRTRGVPGDCVGCRHPQRSQAEAVSGTCKTFAFLPRLPGELSFALHTSARVKAARHLNFRVRDRGIGDAHAGNDIHVFFKFAPGYGTGSAPAFHATGRHGSRNPTPGGDFGPCRCKLPSRRVRESGPPWWQCARPAEPSPS